MIIRPLASAGTPAPRPDKKPEELTRDLVEKGVELTVPRWIRLFGHRRVKPEEAAEIPRELCARVPGKARLPVRSPEDLTELAVFQGLVPSSVLPQPALAEALRALDQSHWQFQSPDHQEVGAYGAYQALTEKDQTAVTADWNGHQIHLDTQNAEQLARFYDPDQPHPLAKLEQAGYDLYDASGERCAAPQAVSVGRHTPWLEAGRIEELPRFEALQPEQGDLALTRAAHDLPVGDAEAVRKLLAGVKPEEHRRLLPAALRAMQGVPGKKQVEVADALPADPEARQKWAAHLADDPEVGPAASITAGLLKKGEDVWRQFADQPDREPVSFLREALQARPRPAVAEVALQALQQRPASAAAARAMEIWQGGPEQVARLLAHPDLGPKQIDALGTELYGQDPTARPRLLQARAERALPSAGLAAEVWPRLKTETARKLVFKAGMGDKSGAELYLPLLDELKQGSSWEENERLADARQIATAARVQLQAHPVVAAMDRWQVADPEAVVRSALSCQDTSPDNLLALGLKLCSDRDYALQERLLQEQATRPGQAGEAARAALELTPQLKSHPARLKTFQMATREPERATRPVELGRVLLQETTVKDEYDYQKAEKLKDAALVAARLRPLLAQNPVLQALDRWGQGEEVWRIREALEHDSVKSAEEVHRYGVRMCNSYNTGLRDQLLEEQKHCGRQPEARAAEVARQLLPSLQSRPAQTRLWELVTREPTTATDERALYARLLDSVKIEDEYDYQRSEKQKDAELLASRLRPLLAQSPVLQALDRWGQGEEVWRIREALAQDRIKSAEDVHRYGVGMCGSYNTGLRDQLLEEQKSCGRQPEARAAEVARQLMPALKSRPAQTRLWELVTRDPAMATDERGLYAQLLGSVKIEDEYDYQRVEKQKDAELLASRLRPLLAQSPVLQALDRWGQGEEIWRIREALEHDRLKSPQEVHQYGVRLCGGYNSELRLQLLADQKACGRQPEAAAAEVAEKLLPVLRSGPAQNRLWQLTTSEPATLLNERSLYADLLGNVKIEDEYDYQRQEKQADANLLAARLRPLLAQTAVLQALDRWGQGDEIWRIGQALAYGKLQTPEEVHRYGVELATTESELRTRLLEEQKASGRQPEAQAAGMALSLLPSLKSRAARNEMWTAATRHPASAARPAALYARVLEAVAVNEDYDWEKDTKPHDARLLATHGLEALRQDPATRDTVAQLERWQPPDPVKLFQVARAGGTRAELAVALCPVGDNELQDRILALENGELARLTRKLRKDLQSPNARYALWRAALEKPELKTGEEVREFGRLALQHFDQSRPFGQAAQERPKLESVLDTYVQVMSLVAPAAPTALREEEKRVVVGGVVVKKAGSGVTES